MGGSARCDAGNCKLTRVHKASCKDGGCSFLQIDYAASCDGGRCSFTHVGEAVCSGGYCEFNNVEKAHCGDEKRRKTCQFNNNVIGYPAIGTNGQKGLLDNEKTALFSDRKQTGPFVGLPGLSG